MLKVFVLLVCSYSVCFAYLDPSTGSLLLSSFIALFASVIFLAKGIFYKIVHKSYKKSYEGGGGGKHKTSLCFYSEGKQYYNVFKPILDYLDSISYPYTYFAAHKDDLALKRQSSPNADISYIGSSNSSFAKLNTLSADLMLLTTPQLNVLQLKRSKKVKHYCHIIHSLPHIDIYEVFALDYFDSVFTNSPIHTDFIREIESIRGLKPKQVTITGCTYLDVLKEKLDSLKAQNALKPTFFPNTKKPIILLSPSWGREALLSKYGMQLITPLLECDVNIILRPHPQSLISESKLLDSLRDCINKHKNANNLKWDSTTDNIYAMSEADLMIGDFSGVIFDFISLFEKPVLTIKFQFNTIGYDLEDTNKEPWVKHILPKIGAVIEDFSNLKDTLHSVLYDKARTKEIAQNIAELKALLWHFQGKAGERSALELLKIHKRILESSLHSQYQTYQQLLFLNKILEDTSTKMRDLRTKDSKIKDSDD